MSNKADDSVTEDILNLEVEQCEDEEPEPTNENVNVGHPWPYLSDMFAIKSISKTNAKVTCLLCAPKYKECSSSLSSLSNLRTHVKVGIFRI